MPPRPRHADPLDDVTPTRPRKRGSAGGSAAHAPFQTIFDGLKDAAGAALRGEATAYADLLRGPAADWIKHFAQNALPRMRAMMARGAPCALEAYDPHGRPTRCPDTAAFGCVVCQRPCCPAHAFLAWTGDAICPACVQRAQQTGAPQSAWQRPPPWSGAGQAPPPPPHDPAAGQRQKAEEAFTTLGLQFGAPWPLVEAKWKELVREGHPDRFPPAQRAAQEDRIKQVNAAFQFLKSLHDQQPRAA